MFHFSIGVDDVCLSLYLDKGLLAVYNRWVLFFLNRILHLNILSWPYQITEAIAILLMVVAAYVWCASFEKVICTGNVSLNPWICGLASALFISCPILSELWVYYLHNGVSIGYLVTGCSVYLFLTTFAKENTHKFSKLVICGILLAVGMGCYETMIECFIVVVILLFMILRAYKDNDTYDVRFYKWIVFGTVVFAISLAIRKGITELFKYIVDYSSFDQYKPAIYRPMFGDVFSAPGLLGMIIKRFFIRYYVNAVVYLPILFLVILWAILGIFAIKYFLKKKDILIIVCVPVMMLCPIAMSIVCGSTELYRSAQYIPLLIMSGAFVVYSEIKKEYKNDKLPCLLLYSAIFAGGGGADNRYK